MCLTFAAESNNVASAPSKGEVGYRTSVPDTSPSSLASKDSRALLKEVLLQSRREHAVVLLEAIEALRRLIGRIDADREFAKCFNGTREALVSHLELLSKTFGEEIQSMNDSH